MRVRDLPRLTHTVEVKTPSGRFYRWAGDEPDPANRPSGLRHSSTMPGGYEACDLTLPRLPGRNYPDLERLSTIRVLDAGGGIVWEGRLERAPRSSGDRVSVSPGAVGYQAHLEDDKSASMIYVDRDLSAWANDWTELRALRAGAFDIRTLSYQNDKGGVVFELPNTPVPAQALTEALYRAPAGTTIAAVEYAGTQSAIPAGYRAADVNFADNEADMHSGGGTYQRVLVTLDGTLRTAQPTTPRRNASLTFYANGAGATPAVGAQRTWSKLAVYGDHGLTRRAVAGETAGLYASDIVAHAVGTWAPLLNVTEGPDGTIQPTTFVIPHAVHRDLTTAAEIVRQALRYGLQDWAVWDNRTFVMHDRGARGRNWRARVGPAQLEETGSSVERLWNSVIVQYQDVDGTTRTVGPPGSGADSTSTDLEDADPENPANILGIRRRDLLTMGISTPAAATEIGRRFLQETKQLDRSGRARFVGHVEDDRGVTHPYSHVRAGDTVTFVDSGDTSARRIVKADHDDDAKTCAVDLDAPPEGLQATLERLGVVLTPLGL